MPLSGGQKDPFAGWAATLVDGLDTLYIMGLQEEFDNALKALDSIDFSTPKAERVPVFETTIRFLGGLLGAYDVSGPKYPIILQKADQLGEFLLRAFNTSTGIPVPYFWWGKQDDILQGENNVIIAQIGSLSLEFTRLAQLTGKRKYFDSISKITNHLDAAQNHTRIPGLWPSTIDTKGPSFPSASFTLGAFSDSLYEYLPKEHILLGGNTDQYLRMYRAALGPAAKYHFFQPKTPGNQDILFTGSLEARSEGPPSLNPDVQHLGCYAGGMVGLGARINNSPEELAMAIRLTNGCVWSYQNTASGIMPEIFSVEACQSPCEWTDENAVELGHQHGFTRVVDSSYQLHPEAIESVFVMYRITGDPIWQERGWKMFKVIVKHTRTAIANSRLQDVTNPVPPQEDSMESFWLAETLKYFFLLFSEPDVISLDDFVLNTEAHPFRQRDSSIEL
ncbi:putative mannosyl-oligosaccharide alpha-1,2-mannosidase [Mollisia scopiformis]|uniref:alpha-1,2-Mannosidase n=1 Tax=Mollisia scopiformis TaxID=149040 RepID=A0A194XVK3_MOLSC|nr:putative mannosyl-oligosaccharide alpha-1,2-mannosidase [Mollisia scopiformis]KUJ24161.1 putative mannosyl-oligosaccharide alpha-1,2-mannosidase [Mollisia scopiformis]